MSLSNEFPTRCKDEIPQLLRHGNVPQASIHIERADRFIFSRTFYKNGHEEELGDDGNGKSTFIYAIGSLTKLLVALLMSIIVDKLSNSEEPKHARYRRLRTQRDGSPWDESFTTLFNSFSDVKMSPLPRNPKLRHVLLHYNSLPPMNSTLFGPDGTSLLSEREFIRVAPRLAQAEYGKTEGDYIAYSNGNYILVGLLIKAIARDSIANLMRAHILGPLNMSETYMSIPERSNLVACPHVVSATDGLSRLPDLPPDDIAIPALGAYSSTKDLAILMRAIQRGIRGGENIFERDSIERLLKPEARFSGEINSAYTFCGISTTLDTSIPGCKSINRFISPDDICSTYKLGIAPKEKQAKAYYLAGAVHGYTSCLYFMPKWDTFVTILANASGIIDATDHISRLVLQELFTLERSTKDAKSIILPSKVLETQSPNLKMMVNILDMSYRGSIEGQKLLERWAVDDAKADTQWPTQAQLDGTYFNKLNEQSIVIKEMDNGRFSAVIKGAEKSSRVMGLVRTEGLIVRLCPLPTTEFTIDRYDSRGWRDLTFKLSIEEGDEYSSKRVVSLTRCVAPLLGDFERQG